MNKRIEDYGLIGNLVSCALVGKDGSIDWLCLPRFDSDACFAALVGKPEHGRWLITPKDKGPKISRRYLPETAVLETTFETTDGAATLTDFMPLGAGKEEGELIRIVSGVRGSVAMEMDLVLRFGYGQAVPWVRRRDYGIRAVAGPDAIDLVSPMALINEDLTTRAEFTVQQGQSVPFTLTYHPSTREPRFIDDRRVALQGTVAWWHQWVGRHEPPPDVPRDWAEALVRSLITLKMLTFLPTGGLVAAATTSLPEQIGGVRNWDYRYCWIRDATLTIYAFINAGYFEEADEFRKWLLRAAAGDPDQMQIMYGLSGERRLTEIELPWLPGFEDSRPVRIGNAAHAQLQLDVYGELMDALHAARRSNLGPHHAAWHLQSLLLKRLERIWREPDESIWEMRSGPRHFTYSKVMSWVAFDRGIKTVEQFGLEGPADRWRAICGEIRDDIMANAYDPERNAFVQSYGGRNLDASLLQLAQVGFLQPEDARFRGTVEAVERELMEDGMVLRYRVGEAGDGLPGSEAAFFACSFWLADAYVQLKRYDDAAALFNRLLSVRNDLGLLAEEYDPRNRRMLGNFPQAYSHVGLVNTAHNLLQAGGPAAQRAEHKEPPQANAVATKAAPEPIDRE